MSHANPHVDAETLLEHVDWVRRLARGLVSDPNAADDVVQEAWLAALRSPPEAGNVRGWFARVVRNAALERARRESRRAHRETIAARPEALPSSADVVARVATQQHLVQRVLELDEPYRATVLLRYFEELTPEQIAARTNTPVATVKTRLRRALAELRTRLDREHGGDGRTWMLALMSLAQPPQVAGTIGIGALFAMNVKSFLIAVGVLVAALCVLVVVRDSGIEPPAETAHVVAAPQLVEPERAVDALVAKDVESTRVATTDSTLRVRVVDAATDELVAGAELWTAQVDWTKWYDPSVDRDAYVREHGVRTKTDENGFAVVPQRDKPYVALAWHEGSFGESILVPHPVETGTVRLVPDLTLRVQVVDERGAPVVGAGVQLFEIARDDGDRATSVQNGAIRTVAPEGIATIAHFAQRMPQLQSAGVWAAARIHAALTTPVEARFDPRAVPAEPLKLVLPPTGRVVVHVEDADGRPCTNLWTHITPIALEAAEGGIERRRTRSGEVVRDGRAVFEHVGLGLELEIASQVAEHADVSVRRAGPRRAGEEVVVTLRATERLPVLVGRVVDPSGAVPQNSSLDGRLVLEIDGEPPREESVGVITEAGRFRIPVRLAPGEKARAGFHVRTRGAGDVLLTADYATSDVLRPGENEVGDLVLKQPAIVLSGHVRDSAGGPVYWAVVDFARMKSADDPPELAPYEWLNGQRAMTDKDGRFTATGVLEPGEYVVEVRRDGYVDTGFLPFAPGTRDRTIVVTKCGVIEGSVLATEGVAVADVAIEARPRVAPEDQRAWSGATTRVLANGTFRIDGVPPGIVDLHVRVVGDAAPATSILGVVVPEGTASADPRLAPIDLRSLVGRPITLTLEGPDRRAIPSAAVAIRPAGEASATAQRILCEDGRLTLVTRSAAVDVEIRAPGMRTTRVEGVSADRTVVLQPGIPITVELPSDLALPEAPFELVLVLRPPSEDPAALRETLQREDSTARASTYERWTIGQASVFDARRSVQIGAPEPGSYRTEWKVVLRDMASPTFGPVRSAREQEEFDVLESDAGRTYRLAPDTADLAEVIERMRAR